MTGKRPGTLTKTQRSNDQVSQDNALDRYNAVMQSKAGREAYHWLGAYARAYLDGDDLNDFMNRAIDAALERCGEPFYRGCAVRAVMLSPSHHIDLALDRYLLLFGP